MRDYKGNNPDFKITNELITPAEVKDNRWAPLAGSFYSASVALKTHADGTPFTDFVFKQLDVAVQLHTDPSASPVYMYLEFPNGVPADLLLEYQAVDLSNEPQTDALNDLLVNLANVDEDYYEEDIENKPSEIVPSKHSHRLSKESSELIADRLKGLFNKSPEELTIEHADELSAFLAAVSIRLDTEEQDIVLAINELVRVYVNVAGKISGTLLSAPGGLDTVATQYVPALNEVATAINEAASSTDSQFDLYGYIYTDTDLSRSMTGGSKVWLVKARAVITGLFDDDASAKTLEAGDTVYYENALGRLTYAPLGVALSLKQDAIDPAMPGDDKSVVNVINRQSTEVSKLRGLNVLSLLGFIASAVDLNSNQHVVDGNTGYFVIAKNAITVTAPYLDGSTYKVLNRTDALVLHGDSSLFTVSPLADIDMPIQSSVDGDLDTTVKFLDGAINELMQLSDAAVNSDVLAFKGEITSNVTLGTPLTSGLWFLKEDAVVTADFTDSAMTSLNKGSLVIYNKSTNKFIGFNVDLAGRQKLVEPRLTTTSKNVIEAINSLYSDVQSVVGDSSNNFQGYLRDDTNITAQCSGATAKEWVVSVDDVVITAPFNDGGNVKVLKAGDVIKYTENLITLDVIANYKVGFVNKVEPELIPNDKRPDRVIATYQVDGVGGGYATGDFFETHRSPTAEEAIPLGSAPVSRTEYADLFDVIGTKFGEGAGLKAHWDQTDSLSTGTSHIFGVAFLGNGDWLVASSFQTPSFSLYNTVTKETQVINTPNGEWIFEITSVPGTDIFYILTHGGNVYGYSRTGEHGLSMTATTVYQPGGGNESSYGFWWDGSETVGVGNLYILRGATNTTCNVYCIGVTGYKTGALVSTSEALDARGHWLLGARYIRDDNVLYFTTNGDSTAVSALAAPYTGNVTTIEGDYGSVAIHRLAWSEVEQCYYAPLFDQLNVNPPTVLKLDPNFKKIATIDYTSFGLTTDHRFTSIAIHPTTGRVALSVTDNSKAGQADQSFLLVQNMSPQETFGIPPKSGDAVLTGPPVDFTGVVRASDYSYGKSTTVLPVTGGASHRTVVACSKNLVLNPTYPDIISDRLFAVADAIVSDGVAKVVWSTINREGEVFSLSSGGVSINGANVEFIHACHDPVSNRLMISVFTDTQQPRLYMVDIATKGYSVIGSSDFNALMYDSGGVANSLFGVNYADWREKTGITLHKYSDTTTTVSPSIVESKLLTADAEPLDIAVVQSTNTCLVLTEGYLARITTLDFTLPEVYLSPTTLISGVYRKLFKDPSTDDLYLVCHDSVAGVDNTYKITDYSTANTFTAELVHQTSEMANTYTPVSSETAINDGVMLKAVTKDGEDGLWTKGDMRVLAPKPTSAITSPSVGTIVTSTRIASGIATVTLVPNQVTAGKHTAFFDVPTVTGGWNQRSFTCFDAQYKYTDPRPGGVSLCSYDYEGDGSNERVVFGHLYSTSTTNYYRLATSHSASNSTDTDKTRGVNGGCARAWAAPDGAEYYGYYVSQTSVYRYRYTPVSEQNLESYGVHSDLLPGSFNAQLGYYFVFDKKAPIGEMEFRRRHGTNMVNICRFGAYSIHGIEYDYSLGLYFIVTSGNEDGLEATDMWSFDPLTYVFRRVHTFNGNFIAMWAMDDKVYWNQGPWGENDIFTMDYIAIPTEFIKA